jgi:hypothetical protein
MAVISGTAWAQIFNDEDIPTPATEVVGPGGLTPQLYFSASLQFGAGYNFETGAKGFRDYGGDNDTSFSFSVAFVDSHYQSPKRFEVGAPKEDQWSARFKFFNYTLRLDTWDYAGELNKGAWLAEISGMNAHIGFFTQAGRLINGLDQIARDKDSYNKPISQIYAGGKVMGLGFNDLNKSYYDIDASDTSTTVTAYKAENKGVFYAGYELPDLFKVYGTALSEGDVNSDVSKGKHDGLAGALDFALSPWGTATGRRAPTTLNFEGSLIGGADFDNNPFGFGLKAEAARWLGGDLVIAPVVAFDGKKMDQHNTAGKLTNDKFYWSMGGGLTFRFSSPKWVSDEWDELLGITNVTYRYENSKILKYAYAQVYAAYVDNKNLLNSDDSKVLNLVFKAEEPDGEAGFHDKLGAMFELRLNNVTKKEVARDYDWAMQGRVSYDLDISKMLITPYVRAYLDSGAVFKLRVGAQANIIPKCGLEIAYTSANLNPDAYGKTIYTDIGVDKTDVLDKGRIELVVVLKNDNDRPKTRKRMDEWNYAKYKDGRPSSISSY